MIVDLDYCGNSGGVSVCVCVFVRALIAPPRARQPARCLLSVTAAVPTVLSLV